MEIGFAFSGGGPTALMCTLCYQAALDGLGLAPVNATVVGVSGGALGYTVYQNVPAPLSYPPLLNDSGFALEKEALSYPLSDAGTWMGQLFRYLPSLSDAQMEEARCGSSWWAGALSVGLELAYGVDMCALEAGPRPYSIGASLVHASALPLNLNSAGVFGEDPSGILAPVSVDMASHEAWVPDTAGTGLTPSGPIEALDAVAMSSAYWADGIVEGAKSLAKNRALISVPTSGTRTVYGMDGGFVEMNGVADLLRRRTANVVAFYQSSENFDGDDVAWAYLFGTSEVNPSTINSLEGPAVAALFDSALWPAFRANMTAGAPVVLRDLSVRANPYFGVAAYTLDTLLVMPNAANAAFLDSFADPDVAAALDARWPDQFPVGIPTLDANVLCLFCGWKVRQVAGLLRGILGVAG